MSRSFAMWIEDASTTRVRGPQILLYGLPLGPAPEAHDTLTIYAPFSPPQRARCKSSLSHPRGAKELRFTFGIDGEPRLSPKQYIGAIVVEEGVMVRAFTARLRAPSALYRAPARFNLGRDRAFGLVSVRRHLLNIAVVGGGLAAAEDFWPSLVNIEPQGHPTLETSDIERLSTPFALDAGYWQLPTLTTIPRDEWNVSLVVAPAGPVNVESASVFVDGEWRASDVYQQPNGLTQVRVEGGPGMDTATVVTPLLAA